MSIYEQQSPAATVASANMLMTSYLRSCVETLAFLRRPSNNHFVIRNYMVGFTENDIEEFEQLIADARKSIKGVVDPSKIESYCTRLDELCKQLEHIKRIVMHTTFNQDYKVLSGIAKAPPGWHFFLPGTPR